MLIFVGQANTYIWDMSNFSEAEIAAFVDELKQQEAKSDQVRNDAVMAHRLARGITPEDWECLQDLLEKDFEERDDAEAKVRTVIATDEAFARLVAQGDG